MNIISPVTGRKNAKVVKKLNHQIIIDLYKKDLGIDTKKYFLNKDVIIYKCKDSLYRFYYPATLAGDDLFYEELQMRPKSYYSWRWEHQKALDEINKDDFVLDVGCGSGYFLEKLLNKTTNIKGLEYNDLAIKQCKEKNIPVVKSDIQHFSKENIETFDVVCAFQVLEHVYDIQSFIDSCVQVLKPNGKLIIGVPNNNPYLFKHDLYHTLNLPPHHIGLWNKKSLKRLPRFFSLKNDNLYIEPNNHYDHWFNVQINYFFGKSVIGKIVRRATYKIVKKFSSSIDGRNILAIYRKDDK
ncbi:2-polyprenyl-3-methyl-5-hydroxy-6-metoxy-1,4-benzoquinol methylase [Dysgonomonas hofstadii]|uniref:2-polyprenyl-3-methyl-5-hydroxy-6-metoxy-1, 4-benzoquinol methylase n=1 Tax=Dysgonomonas hofstadii TaxID=637886 RepID=A0A840CRA1_9BACT|nr:class I SAM-dependent methyltransferase [Dysgonomonas hofstadii]MBB4035072.1 2-polyprenyl-3-methyl-5-hydroxy-6-metoxy-1,4-benzoquinol methylase [Dysgonomonas hofstadii]